MILIGDCREVMAGMEAASVDAVVCDPPYMLTSGKKGGTGEASVNLDSPYGRARISTGNGPGGFMGKKWDAPDDPTPQGAQAWHESWAVEAFRVLKPGGHLLAFSGTRTSHRMVCAIEDAGFEIRDTIMWIYGSGFPKSLDVSKAIDKRGGRPDLTAQIGAAIKAVREQRGMSASECDRIFCDGTTNWTWFEGRPAGQRAPTPETFARIVEQWPELSTYRDMVAEAEREVTGQSAHKSGIGNGVKGHYTVGGTIAEAYDITAPATPEAERWAGWGTALKPAHEPICVARKPLIGTVARNVLEHGTGALNIDGCRINPGDPVPGGGGLSAQGSMTSRAVQARVGYRPPGAPYPGDINPESVPPHTSGRWPSNVILSHHPDCVEVGVRRVKGSNGSTRGGRASTDDYRLHHETGQAIGYASPDGTETISAWECHPECAVAALDAQSGERKAGSPAHEPICVARKPLVGTVARNVLEYGTGALNIDASRVGGSFVSSGGPAGFHPDKGWNQNSMGAHEPKEVSGRWPANVILSDSAVAALDEQSGERKAGSPKSGNEPQAAAFSGNVYGDAAKVGASFDGYGDTGGASRFFLVVPDDAHNDSSLPIDGEDVTRFRYQAKTSRAERNAGLDGMPERAAHLLDEATLSTASNRRCRLCGRVKFGQPHCECEAPDWEETKGSIAANHHPTVKPIALMKWLITLVTPPGGTVLDPFAGSGSTGCAAAVLGVDFVGIEQDPEYAEIARRRIAHWTTTKTPCSTSTRSVPTGDSAALSPSDSLRSPSPRSRSTSSSADPRPQLPLFAEQAAD
jgi:DNA modification methylase